MAVLLSCSTCAVPVACYFFGLADRGAAGSLAVFFDPPTSKLFHTLKSIGMSSATLEKWVVCRRSRPDASVRLLCAVRRRAFEHSSYADLITAVLYWSNKRRITNHTYLVVHV